MLCLIVPLLSDWDHVYHKRYIREPITLLSGSRVLAEDISLRMLSSLYAADGPTG